MKNSFILHISSKEILASLCPPATTVAGAGALLLQNVLIKQLIVVSSDHHIYLFDCKCT